MASLAACGGRVGADSAPPGGSSGPASPTPAASVSPTPVPSIDAAAALADALAAMADAYAFEATVTVGDQLATRAAGRWVGGASEVVVQRGDTTVTYRSIPPTAWVLEPDGAWVEVEGEVPGGDPLDALRAPKGLEVAAATSEATELQATYPAAALGLAGDDPVEVVIRIAADGSVTATYTTELSGARATSATTLRPLADASPVPAPSLGG